MLIVVFGCFLNRAPHFLQPYSSKKIEMVPQKCRAQFATKLARGPICRGLSCRGLIGPAGLAGLISFVVMVGLEGQVGLVGLVGSKAGNLIKFYRRSST